MTTVTSAMSARFFMLRTARRCTLRVFHQPTEYWAGRHVPDRQIAAAPQPSRVWALDRPTGSPNRANRAKIALSCWRSARIGGVAHPRGHDPGKTLARLRGRRTLLGTMDSRLTGGRVTMTETARLGPRRLLIAAAALLIATVAGAGIALSSSASDSGAPGETDVLRDTGALIVRRIDLADPVARSKWLSGTPIDDAQREEVVLDEAAHRASEQGTDTDLVRRVFRAQIDASKTVQRGLMEQWKQHPDAAPTSAPDLTTVRTELDEIGGSLVSALGRAADVAGRPECPDLVATERERDAAGLDDLHRSAVETAWQTFCAG
ncbi:gamma subclass chorismate mutase AroQ [Rathayibacter tritici]|nr:gamma subclass chorismate mutase AroQ [Rathayibacter tritici]PPI16821.1 gamma subclass chorismate mutase AroQ [Rathayibacter tritici]